MTEVWLVDRQFDSKGLVRLTYATEDGERVHTKELAEQRLVTGGGVTAGRDVDASALGERIRRRSNDSRRRRHGWRPSTRSTTRCERPIGMTAGRWRAPRRSRVAVGYYSWVSSGASPSHRLNRYAAPPIPVTAPPIPKPGTVSLVALAP